MLAQRDQRSSTSDSGQPPGIVFGPVSARYFLSEREEATAARNQTACCTLSPYRYRPFPFSLQLQETVMRNGALHSSLSDLRSDLQTVARDAEALLKATADVAGDRVQEARAKAQETLSRTYERLYDRKMKRRVRKLASTTDSYVRDHSWSAIGIAVGIGLVVGLLSRRDD